MYVVMFFCGVALALMLVWKATNFAVGQMRKAAGYQTPRRNRRGRFVPISATHLPV
ncbi:MAG TPA: hypothetical protein VF699_00475 [Caulobacteraceae bacterium]|jgi:hypothetical protein